jgi:sugar fermentation stimulation protein A
MRFPSPLVPARLIRRRKRFLAEVAFDDGAEAVAHCPNPGSMLGLAEPGARIWVMSAAPGKALAWSWKLVELPGGHFAQIDTALPNRLAGAALRVGALPGLSGYAEVRAEVPCGAGSRVDFRLSAPGQPPAWVEVKAVTLRRAGDLAEFPDSVTARGARHLGVLAARARAGERAVLLYLAQRTDVGRLRLARDLDPGYAAAADAARAAGVEMLCWGCAISPGGVRLAAPLPVEP